jgi:prepilin-type processing-associated H-X9-DG protein
MAYHNDNNQFPVGQFNCIQENYDSPSTQVNPGWCRACWVHFILPYIEQGNLFQVYYNVASPNDAPGGLVLTAAGKTTVIKTLICPADGNSPKTNTVDTNATAAGTQVQGLHDNYVGCAGDGYGQPTAANSPGSGVFYGGFGPAEAPNTAIPYLDGMFFVQSQTKIGSITDGTSNSMMLSEILVVPDTTVNDLRGRYNNSWTGNNLFTTLYSPNTTVADVQNYQGVNVSFAPTTSGTNNNMSARSNHTNAVNALFADGHVVIVPNSINLTVWHALSTIAGGEPNTSF